MALSSTVPTIVADLPCRQKVQQRTVRHTGQIDAVLLAVERFRRQQRVQHRVETFVHLIGIPLTGTSVNPARSLAPAIFAGGDALKQVWLFILAPFVGAILAGLIHKAFYANAEDSES